MGYESRLYVVGKTKGKKPVYAQVYAMIDLCKVYEVSGPMKQYPDTDAYIYAEDGNTIIEEDRYGEPLTEIPLEDAIKIIKQAADNDSYWRYKACLALLEAMRCCPYGEPVVLHFGH